MALEPKFCEECGLDAWQPHVLCPIDDCPCRKRQMSLRRGSKEYNEWVATLPLHPKLAERVKPMQTAPKGLCSMCMAPIRDDHTNCNLMSCPAKKAKEITWEVVRITLSPKDSNLPADIIFQSKNMADVVGRVKRMNKMYSNMGIDFVAGYRDAATPNVLLYVD